MTRFKMEVDGEGFLKTVSYGVPLTEVRITSPEGIVAKGYAKLMDGDSYDPDFGEYLADLRASSRLYEKMAKRVAKAGA